MEERLRWTMNGMKKELGNEGRIIDRQTIREVQAFHESFEAYDRMPLCRLDALAGRCGVGAIYVKDESKRFGLNAFKVLGATYAIGKSLALQLERPLEELPFPVMRELVKIRMPDLKLAATTDGNHGRGVAWMGRQLGARVAVYMPKGTTQNRLNHILNEGAQVQITEMNYDDTVRFVAGKSREEGWQVIQDTAWEGYLDVPRWIMQGYSTVAREAIEQLAEERPTHVLLQVGVGAFAAVMTDIILQMYKDGPPKIIIVEAAQAACFYESALKGKMTPVTGDLSTIMAGLACGEPNPIAYDILIDSADAFIAAEDRVSAKGMRMLGNPLEGDPRIISGESGAVGIGVLEAVMMRPEYRPLRAKLQLGQDSRVLIFSTEGDTDPQVYRSIVWDGMYPDMD